MVERIRRRHSPQVVLGELVRIQAGGERSAQRQLEIQQVAAVLVLRDRQRFTRIVRTRVFVLTLLFSATWTALAIVLNQSTKAQRWPCKEQANKQE